MNCGQARGLFGAYWDDELTQAEREWLERHFTACPRCRESYETLSRSLELVAELPRAEAPPDLAERALARARHADPAPDRLPVASPRWVPVAAAAAVLLVAGMFAIRFAPRHESAPVAAMPEPVRTTAPATPAVDQVPVEQATLVAGAIPDSLFDHSEDVEFILDPVTIRRGHAHPATRLAPSITRGEQATITF